MIGEHTVTVTPLAGGSVDISCVVDEVSIRHGRDDTDTQPEASSCTLELSTREVMPPELEIGATITVTTQPGATSFTRFMGRVTDMAYGWDDAGEETPDRPIGQVLATSLLSELGRRVVGDVPYAQELDGARVARVMAAAGITLDPLFSDPGTVQILARDIDSQPALAVAQGAAESARGVLWQTRAGEVRYADSEHRRGTTPALELDACDILVTPTWRRTTEGLVNEVSIGYGVAPEGGEQPRYVNTRADSIARFGRYGLSTTTELAAAGDATAMGSLLLARNGTPVWILGELPVDVKNLGLADTEALLSLDMHSLLALTGMPAVGNAPTSTSLWVEGITERLAWGEHELSLIVSGYCRTVPAPRWDDVLPTMTWDTAPGTWDEATCLGPQPSQGRWTDVPATLRWDQVPATTTWDTWKG
jgi:hypothetical protein